MKHWRINFVLFLLFLFGAAILGRLVFLQIIQTGYYKALAQGQQNLSMLVKGDRGDLFIQDKNGNLYTLAANQKIPFVFISPPEIENKDEAIAVLTQVLGVKEDILLAKFQKTESLFELVKKRITSEEKERIRKAEIPGVYIGQENVRYYPQETLASHIVGFTNSDGIGQYGIEEYYNDTLEGKEGLRQTVKNPASYLSRVLQDTIEDGSDLILTLDLNIQTRAETLLVKAHEKLKFAEGTIIVIDPQDGRIFALANFPVFDPNKYSQVEELEIFQNSAVQKIFEPGSVMKAITIASAIDQGKITPETTYQDKGTVTISGRTIYNYDQKTYGKQTIAQVLAHSINTGAVFAEQQLGHRDFLKYLEKFQFFAPTNIDTAGEIYSENEVLKNGYDINFATASFGQGIAITPIQLIRSYTALANKGKLVVPFLVASRHKQHKQTQILSAQTAIDVTTMLVDAVDQNRVGKIPGYYIAGKTGTAQIPWSVLGVNKAGYSEETVQSFLGYFPAYNPQFLILVKLDRPQTKAAGASAIPIFKDLAEYLMIYYQIPPDYNF